VLREIEEKKERKEKGLFNGIPFPYPKWRDYIPSIDKGMYLGLLAPSGVGKSRFIRKTFVYDLYEFSKKNKYPIKILYFALEDAKVPVYKKMICHYLWERHQFDISPTQLDSKYVGFDDRYLDIMKRDKRFFEEFETDVAIVNTCSTPQEIVDYCKRQHERFGDSHHIIVIIDNYSNVTKDPHHKTEWEAVRELSRNHIRLDLCKKLNMTVIAVLQTDVESDKNTFRNSDKAAISTLEPNTASIGDIKVIVRDFYLLLGLFHPWKYEIPKYPYKDGYDTSILRNRFRSLLMLKNNEGEMAPRLPLLFDGKHEHFSEMPTLAEKDALDKLYARIMKEETEKREMIARKGLFND
jgi:hypothetical protein